MIDTNRLPLFTMISAFGILVVAFTINWVYGQSSPSLVNVSELDTLDRMRYTAIQMTILDLENNQSLTNTTTEEIVNEIFRYQKSNDSINRLTTLEIENLYGNITAPSQQHGEEFGVSDSNSFQLEN